MDFNHLNEHPPLIQKTNNSVHMHPQELVKKQTKNNNQTTPSLITQDAEKHKLNCCHSITSGVLSG